jgi:hypothetical protein
MDSCLRVRFHSRAGRTRLHEMGHDPFRYPVSRVMDAADQATRGGRSSLSDQDPPFDYWAAQGYWCGTRWTICSGPR